MSPLEIYVKHLYCHMLLRTSDTIGCLPSYTLLSLTSGTSLEIFTRNAIEQLNASLLRRDTVY